MHIKKRKNRALVIRSTYVRKGVRGNTHGFSEPKYVASLPLNILAIPPELDAELTDDERAYLIRALVQPAREAAELRQREEEAKAIDPTWRVEDALVLLKEAELLAQQYGAKLAPSLSERLLEVLKGILVDGKAISDGSGESGSPLQDLLGAIGSAASAISSGAYGPAQGSPSRDTEAYKLWTLVRAAFDGDTPDSLLRVLQTRRIVERRNR